jgi:hypothetical protein
LLTEPGIFVPQSSSVGNVIIPFRSRTHQTLEGIHRTTSGVALGSLMLVPPIAATLRSERDAGARHF